MNRTRFPTGLLFVLLFPSVGNAQGVFQATWVGRDADVVSKGSELRPDGEPDGHFHVQTSFSAWREVMYVALRSADASGNATGGQVWHTRDAGSWILGVVGDQWMNARLVTSLGRFIGPVGVDLYAGDSGWFNPGQTFVVEIGLDGNEVIEAVVRIAGANAPLASDPGTPGSGVQTTPAANPAAGPPVPADWNTRGDPHRGEVGTRYSYICPPNGTIGPVWGTDVYTDDSSVCTAAVHAGLMTLAEGGTVTIEMRGGESAYRGEPRNGITSWNYGAWNSSFVFPRPGDPPATPPLAGGAQAEGGAQAGVDTGAGGAQDGVPPSGGALPPTDGAQTTTAGGAPTPLGGASSRLTALQAAWIGLDDDLVQPGSEVRPDGSRDGHFRVDASFSFWQDVTYFALFSADEAGNKAGGQVWHSRDSAFWVLAVLVDGMNLNTRHIPLLGAFHDNVTFDLYAPDSGVFRPGQTVLVEIGLDGAAPQTRVVRIGEAPAAEAPPAGGAPTTPVSGGPPVEGAGPAVPADWNTRGDSHRGEVGTRHSYTCPPNGTIGPVWGTDVYTDDSSICTAAVHAGLITLAGGGTVTIEMRGGESAYRGEPRNGITSWNYGTWDSSFVFPRPGDPPATPPLAGGATTDGAPVSGGTQAGGAASSTDPTQATNAGGAPTPLGGASSRLTALQAAWIGQDDDFVQRGSEVRPDGSPDGHFRVDASFSFWQDVTYIALFSADEAGNKAGGQVWHSRDSAFWVLGVLVDGMNLNPRHVPLLGAFRDDVTFDLYAGDSGAFRPGQTFLVEIGLDGAAPETRLVRIGGGPPAAEAPPIGETPTTPVSGAPPVVEGAGPPVTADWNTRGDSHRGEVGTRYTYTCPPNGTAGPVWGTDVYTDDSSVCTAAVHAGLITLAGGGTVTIEMRGGEANYRGQDRNGITSWNYGAWGSSFVFPRPGDPPATAANALRGPEICGVWRWFDRSVVVFDADGGLEATGVNAPSLMLVDRGRWELADPAGRQYRISWPVGQDLLTLSPDQNGLGGTNVGGAVQVSATRTGACGASPPSPPDDFDAHLSSSADWVGMDADVVSKGASATADGEVDGHFTFTYDTDIGPYEIRSITVESSDAAGNPSGGQVWTTASSQYWVLGVFRQGARLNDGHVPSLGTHQGFRSFDLYAGDSGWFQPGQHFVVEVDMGGGTPIRQVVRIPESFQRDVSPQADPSAEPEPSPPEEDLPVPTPMFAGSIALEHSAYREDESVRVSFRGFAGDERIVVAFADANPEEYITGVWPNGSPMGAVPPATRTQSGSVAFTGFYPGEYEIRVFTESPEEGQWPQLTEIFTVESAAPAGPDQEPPSQQNPQSMAGQYRVTGLSAAWIGVDADVVSTVTVSPDGAADGHFAVDMTFEGEPSVSYVTVYSSDASGNPSGGQVWHTQNSGYAVLAVSAWGHLLNAGYVGEIGRFSDGAARLDLYGFDSGWFQPGQSFVVELGFADGQKVARVVQLTGAAAPPPPLPDGLPPPLPYRLAGLSATWIGIDADVVSSGASTVPDGAPDGRLFVDVTIEGSVELRSVTMYSSDAQGNPSGGQVWTTASGTSWWVLGVGAGGRLLHMGQVGSLGSLQQGTTRLDLFAANSGWFNPGQSFLVELEFGDGQKAGGIVQVTGAPPLPDGIALPVPATPGASPIDWFTGPMAHRGANGQRFAYFCPPNGSQGPLWGTGIHTDDSSVCTAAVHAGLITFASGGAVTIEIRPGQSSYPGGPGAGGVTSRDWGAYEGSFTVVGAAGAAAPMPASGGPTQDFYAPMWNGVRLDWCLVWGGQCGEPAATEFCRQSGYTRATAWEPALDVGTQTPTFVIGTGQICNEPGCDGFTSISCAR